jgi:hypothetical protein
MEVKKHLRKRAGMEGKMSRKLKTSRSSKAQDKLKDSSMQLKTGRSETRLTPLQSKSIVTLVHQLS